jgi:translocation and assembly module TamA
LLPLALWWVCWPAAPAWAQAPAAADSAVVPAAANVPAKSTAATAFDVVVQAPDNVRPYLERHLELQRYRAVTDLDSAELARLLTVAEKDTRELLGTLGYFAPDVAISQQDTPANAQAARRVTVKVRPGELTRVAEVAITFSGPISSDAHAEAQRRAIRGGWLLPVGRPFTQAGWDEAKTQALRQLTARHFPLGKVLLSRAEVDPETHSAHLSVTLDSGPSFRLGALQISGLSHYSATTVQRLARLFPGTDYDQNDLLQAQQRLAASGYFDSAFVTLDTSGDDPARAPVLVQLREAQRQKLVLGLGASTDSGPRVSVEHTHHQFPILGWGEQSKLALDRKTQSIASTLTAPPDEDNWRWVAGGSAIHDTAQQFQVNSQSLRFGRTQTDEQGYDRSYYLLYEKAATNDPATPSASALTLNYSWTQRKFDALPFPDSGYGLGVEIAGGSTLGSDRQPFVRLHARWLGMIPLAKRASASDPPDPEAFNPGRLALRLEGGALLAKDGVNPPATQLFLAGGDTSVRGYAYKEIGIPQASGLVSPGRYLAVGSVEWQRPIQRSGQYSEFEHTVFMDAGAVADQPGQMKAKVGIGTGLRWKSPVGPLQADLAYGVADKRLRLHLSVGFAF